MSMISTVYYKFHKKEDPETGKQRLIPLDLDPSERKLLEPSVKLITLHSFASLGALFYYMYVRFPPMTKLVNTVIIKLAKPSYEFSKSHQNTSALVALAIATTSIAHTIIFCLVKDRAPIRIVKQHCLSKLKGKQYTLLSDGNFFYLFQKNNMTIYSDIKENSLQSFDFVPLEQILKETP